MWALIGEFNEVYQERIGERFEDHPYDEVVALFSTEKGAKDYERKARLKQPKRQSFGPTLAYKERSLLSGAEGARVEDWTEPEYPIDPSI